MSLSDYRSACARTAKYKARQSLSFANINFPFRAPVTRSSSAVTQNTAVTGHLKIRLYTCVGVLREVQWGARCISVNSLSLSLSSTLLIMTSDSGGKKCFISFFMNGITSDRAVNNSDLLPEIISADALCTYWL